MEEVLNKIIKRMVLPKYPWIVDYELSVDNNPRYKRTHYRIDYFVNQDWIIKVDEDERLDKISDVKELTKTLFMALGLDNNHRLDGVEFYNIKYK